MSVKLYLDADITSAPLVATTLRQRGYDVVSAVAVGNNALSDEAQFTYAIEQGRVLLTFNIKDFIPLAEKLYAEGIEFPGLIPEFLLTHQTTKVFKTFVVYSLHQQRFRAPLCKNAP